MDFSVKIEGLDRLDRALPGVAQAIDAEVKKALFVCAKKVESEAKKSILGGGKSGRVYTHFFLTDKKTKQIFPAAERDKPHRASAPGEAPANDTGKLASSINSYLNRDANESFVVAGRGMAKYAPMLEFGTQKIAPRPFMFPALEKSKGWIKERLNAAVRKAVIGIGKK